MPVSTTMGHVPNNLVIMLRDTCIPLIYSTTLIYFVLYYMYSSPSTQFRISSNLLGLDFREPHCSLSSCVRPGRSIDNQIQGYSQFLDTFNRIGTLALRKRCQRATHVHIQREKLPEFIYTRRGRLVSPSASATCVSIYPNTGSDARPQTTRQCFAGHQDLLT